MWDWNKGTESARNGGGFSLFGSLLEQAGSAAEMTRQANERQANEQRQRDDAARQEAARKASGSNW